MLHVSSVTGTYDRMRSAVSAWVTSVLARQVTQAFNSTDGCASYLALRKANHCGQWNGPDALITCVLTVLRQVSLLLDSGMHIADGLCDFVAPSSTHQVLFGPYPAWMSCMQ